MSLQHMTKVPCCDWVIRSLRSSPKGNKTQFQDLRVEMGPSSLNVAYTEALARLLYLFVTWLTDKSRCTCRLTAVSNIISSAKQKTRDNDEAVNS